MAGIYNQGIVPCNRPGKDGNMQYEEIKDLIEIFENTDLTELELKMEETSLRLKRGTETVAVAEMPIAPVSVPMAAAPAVAAAAPAAPAAAKEPAGAGQPAEVEGTLVTAPIVGTFYAGSAPDKPPFVKVGDTIAEGDTLCIIEAMKFMNEVPCEQGGTVKEILVEDGDFVEFGQPLFRIV